jgi:hypothetical protein
MSSFGMQLYFLTIYLQEVLYEGPLRAGLSFLPLAISIVIGTQIGGRLVGRLGIARTRAGAALATHAVRRLNRALRDRRQPGEVLLAMLPEEPLSRLRAPRRHLSSQRDSDLDVLDVGADRVRMEVAGEGVLSDTDVARLGGAEKVVGPKSTSFRTAVPSGNVRSIRMAGVSGLSMTVNPLVRKTTTRVAPSSRCASKYHHS